MPVRSKLRRLLTIADNRFEQRPNSTLKGYFMRENPILSVVTNAFLIVTNVNTGLDFID